VLLFRFTPKSFEAPAQLPEGVRIIPQSHIQAMSGAELAPLGALAAALSGGKVKPGTLLVEIRGVIAQRLHFTFEGAGEGNFGRVVFLLREGAHAAVSESYLGGAGLVAATFEFTLEKAAELRRTVFQEGGPKEVVASTALAELWGGSAYTLTLLSLGARMARLETRLAFAETGAKANINAAYLVGEGLHADVTTHVRHGAPACTTRQIIKGAVKAKGRGVFQGKIHVPKTAGQKTDASMQHHALLLEEGAEVFAKPELEIHADDVSCAHGNTNGALDPHQLFYLRQRGIPEVQARALLIEAFIAEALESAGDLEGALRTAAPEWLHA
jgi:Fe-S cluster assembly protein SufD